MRKALDSEEFFNSLRVEGNARDLPCRSCEKRGVHFIWDIWLECWNSRARTKNSRCPSIARIIVVSVSRGRRRDFTCSGLKLSESTGHAKVIRCPSCEWRHEHGRLLLSAGTHHGQQRPGPNNPRICANSGTFPQRFRFYNRYKWLKPLRTWHIRI